MATGKYTAWTSSCYFSLPSPFFSLRSEAELQGLRLLWLMQAPFLFLSCFGIGAGELGARVLRLQQTEPNLKPSLGLTGNLARHRLASARFFKAMFLGPCMGPQLTSQVGSRTSGFSAFKVSFTGGAPFFGESEVGNWSLPGSAT